MEDTYGEVELILTKYKSVIKFKYKNNSTNLLANMFLML